MDDDAVSLACLWLYRGAATMELHARVLTGLAQRASAEDLYREAQDARAAARALRLAFSAQCQPVGDRNGPTI